MLLRHVASRLIWHDASGALASGAKIYLRGNSVTETGKQVMGNAAKARGLDVIF